MTKSKERENSDQVERLLQGHQMAAIDPKKRQAIKDSLLAQYARGESSAEPKSLSSSKHTSAKDGDRRGLRMRRKHNRGIAMKSKRSLAIGLPIAIMAAAGLLLAVLAHQQLSQAPTSGPAERLGSLEDEQASRSPQPITEPQEELADGTLLRSRPGSEIEVLGLRHLRISKGEVWLDVVHQSTPFMIESPHGEIKVLGTELVVSVDEKETLTSVLRGLVELTNAAGRTQIERGEQARLSFGDAPERRAAPRLSHLVSWARQQHAAASAADALRQGTLIARQPRAPEQEYPLELRRMKVDVVVQDQIARVALDQTFFNQTLYQLEGVYRFPLPPRAALSRLAMYVDGELMESAIVERQRAREVFEDIVFQRRDPVLLEWMQGNSFQMRIFPLAARTERRIIMSYTQSLTSLYQTTQLRIPLPKVDRPLDELEIEVRLNGGAQSVVSSSSHELSQSVDGEDRILKARVMESKLGDDIILSIDEPGVGEPRFVSFEQGGERYFMAHLRPELAGKLDPKPRRWIILYDTSGSRTAQLLKAQAFVLRQMIKHMDGEDEVLLLPFDVEVRPLGDLTAAEGIEIAKLEQDLQALNRYPAGSTDLPAALTAAGQALSSERENLVVYLGDGMDQSGASPKEVAQRLPDNASFFALAIGDEVDAELLEGICEQRGGLFYQLNPGEDLAWRAFDFMAALNTQRLTGIRAQIPNQEVTLFASTSSLAAGESLTLLGRVDAVPQKLRLDAQLDGKPWSKEIELPPSINDKAAYLPRLWARHQIASWIREGAQSHQAAITQLGMKHFLITPYTSLLVVENAKMVQQYKLKQAHEERWAPYQSPTKIPVVYDPLGYSLPSFQLGDLLLRQPISVLNQQVYQNPTPDLLDTLSSAPLAAFDSRSEAWPMQFQQPIVTGAFDFRGDLKNNTWNSIDEDFNGLYLPRGGGGFAKSRKRKGSSYRHQYGANRYNNYGFDLPYPQRLANPWDQALDDLTTFLPGFFTTPLDLQLESLRLNPTESALKPSTEAIELAQKAHSAQHEMLLQDEQGRQLAIESSSKISLRQTYPTGLLEEMVYQDDLIYHTYPELGLATQREVGAMQPYLLLQFAPFLLPEIETCKSLFVITAQDQSLTFTLSSNSAVQLTYELDAQGRVSRVRSTTEQESAEIEFIYGQGSVSWRRGSTQHTYTASEASQDPFNLEALTVISMPLRHAEHYQQQLAEAQAESGEWRQLHRQLMAVALANQNQGDLISSFRQLAQDPNKLQRGEFAMVSFAAANLSRAELNLLTAIPKSERLATYLKRIQESSSRGSFRAGGFDEPGYIDMFMRYRGALSAIDYNSYNVKRAAQAVEAFTTRYPAPELIYVLAYGFSSRWYWQEPELTDELWAALGEHTNQWGVLSRQWRARYRSYQGKYQEAFKTINEALDWAIDNQVSPYPDPYLFTYLHQQPALGEAVSTLWRRWTREAYKSGKAELIEFCLNQEAMDPNLPNSMPFLLSYTPKATFEDLELAFSLAEHALRANNPPLAWRLIAPHVDHLESLDAPQLYTAAHVAFTVNELGRSTKLLEAAIEGQGEEGWTLAQMRSLYIDLIGLYNTQLSLASDADEQHELLGQVFQAAASWRLNDPDCPERDELLATLFDSIGDEGERWRQISNIVELQANAPEYWAKAAHLAISFEEDEKAAALFDRAIDLDITNPTWLLEAAQLAAQQGQDTRRDELLRTIVEGDWHERFASVVNQAKAMRAESERPSPQ